MTFRLAVLFAIGSLILTAQPKQQRRAAAAAAGAEQEPRLERRTIQVAGVERVYYLVKPAGDIKAAPVLMMFHAASSNGAQLAKATGMNRFPLARRALLVYPEGLNQNWNDGRNDETLARGKQDVEFIRLMLDAIVKTDTTADQSRVFAVGLANGGFFVERLACELSGRITGIATVAATFPAKLQPTCKPPDPMPVLLLHGDADKAVPQVGGLKVGAGEYAGATLSAQDTFDHWRKINQCTGDPVVENRVAGETTIEQKIAKGCREGVEVRYLNAKGVGHAWPDGAAREILQFAARFRRLPRL
jgi:polyhydroxybutyrate depolymerase